MLYIFHYDYNCVILLTRTVQKFYCVGYYRIDIEYRKKNFSTKEQKYVWRIGSLTFARITRNKKLCKNAGAQGTIGQIWNNTRKIPVPQSRNMTDVSGLYPLQQSLEIGSYVKMLVRRVLSDKYRIPQEKFYYQGVEICMLYRVFNLCKNHQK